MDKIICIKTGTSFKDFCKQCNCDTILDLRITLEYSKIYPTLEYFVFGANYRHVSNVNLEVIVFKFVANLRLLYFLEFLKLHYIQIMNSITSNNNCSIFLLIF